MARPRKLYRVRCGVWIPEQEEAIEKLWHRERGVNPITGKGWLTPRMEREARNTTTACGLRPAHHYENPSALLY